jgi:hypothetical protein
MGGHEVFPSDFRRIEEHRIDADRTTLEITKSLTGATVAGNLLILETVHPHSDDAAKERQMFRNRDFQMKLCTALVHSETVEKDHQPHF